MSSPEAAEVKVYFLDNTNQSFPLSPGTKVKDLVLKICERLEFDNLAEEACWFGLYESLSGTGLDRPLSNDDAVDTLIHSWDTDGPNKLVFLVKLFFDAVIESSDQVVQYHRCVGLQCRSLSFPSRLINPLNAASCTDTSRVSTQS